MMGKRAQMRKNLNGTQKMFKSNSKKKINLNLKINQRLKKLSKFKNKLKNHPMISLRN